MRTRDDKSEDRPFDFEKILSELPIRPAPPRGYHFGSDLSCSGCPGPVIHVIWDGGVESTSISDRALSRILRAQKGLPPSQCGFNHMSQMSPRQKFSGFADTGESKQYIKVIVQGDLHLVSPDGIEFPALGVRMVPGQHDDVLISAPDLDRWGWDRSRDPNNFLLLQLGISVPRSVSAPTTSDPVEEIELKSLLPGVKLSEKVQIAPLHVRQVRVDLPPNRSLDDVWFTGQVDTLTFSVPDGPIDNNQTLMILRNDTDEVPELEKGIEIGTTEFQNPTKPSSWKDTPSSGRNRR